MTFDLRRRLAAEALGTAILVATVVGSGIMATKLTKDVGLALLGNTVPTGAISVTLGATVLSGGMSETQGRILATSATMDITL
jgi:glycerol uptake facilitator-like aquaporin